MRKYTHALGVIFLVLVAVYFGRAITANAAPAVTGSDSVGQAANTSDVFASSTQPSDEKPADDKVAPPKITASEGGTFSIQINNDVPLVEVLRMVGSQSQVSIIPSKEVRGTVPAMDLYNVTTPEALDAILTSNGFAWEQKGNMIYVYSEKEMADRKKKDLSTVVYRLYYISAADAETLIKKHMSPEGVETITPASVTGITGGGSEGGGAANSGGSSSSSSGNGSGGSGSSTGGNSYANTDLLIVTDHPENQDKISRILKEIDTRPKQVLVEATILECELDNNNTLGINFTSLGSINFSDLGQIPGPGSTSILNSGTSSPNQALVGATPGVSGPQASAGFNALQTGAAGLQVGIIQDDISLFINALETVTNTTVLSNPKVLTLDKQEGKVHIGETIYYTGTTTQTATSNTSTVSSLDTGITLDFRPYIGEDGYIRMEIDPSDSSPVGTGNATLGLPPNINANEVSANIMVKDGRTVLIGGLFQDNDSTSKNQVPFFGNLPLAGPLFGNQADSTTRKEIIFLLTPHIVKDDAAFSGLSEAEIRDAERMRVGVRQGMMPWGRERLADTCYECAMTEMRKPHPDMNLVRWHLDCATNLNPNFLEAIKMKEKVTGQQLAVADNSSIRSFLRRQVALDQLHGVELPPPAPKAVKISSTTQP